MKPVEEEEKMEGKGGSSPLPPVKITLSKTKKLRGNITCVFRGNISSIGAKFPTRMFNSW